MRPVIRALSGHSGTLGFLKGKYNVDMRYVCPKDVKKMLLNQARTTYCKKWDTKHEDEELKEGIWLEPTLALLRRRTKEGWTDKHRFVARKLGLGSMGAEKTVRCWMVGRKHVPRMPQRRGNAEAQTISLPKLE